MCGNQDSFFTVIAERRSIRNYEKKDVEEEQLLQVLEAARMAPSANNRQDWRFVVVRDPEKRRRLAEAANGQKFVAEAPVVIACCSVDPETRMRCGQPVSAINVAIAIDHMTLAAAALGLGTCWIGSFYPDQVKPLLNIPSEVAVVELLALGYPADIPPARPRKNLDEIVYYEEWKD